MDLICLLIRYFHLLPCDSFVILSLIFLKVNCFFTFFLIFFDFFLTFFCTTICCVFLDFMLQSYKKEILICSKK